MAPALMQFIKPHQNLSPIERESEDLTLSIKNYFEKMPTPCYLSQSHQQIDRQAGINIPTEI